MKHSSRLFYQCLRKSDDFRVVLAEGRRARGGGILLYAYPNQIPGCCRLGIVVGKKVGGAVVRNRSKRLVREFFRLHREELPEGTDFVVRVSEDISSLKLRELEVRMLALTRELGAGCQPS